MTFNVVVVVWLLLVVEKKGFKDDVSPKESSPKNRPTAAWRVLQAVHAEQTQQFCLNFNMIAAFLVK
jgi:hypothetical protein